MLKKCDAPSIFVSIYIYLSIYLSICIYIHIHLIASKDMYELKISSALGALILHHFTTFATPLR